MAGYLVSDKKFRNIPNITLQEALKKLEPSNEVKNYVRGLFDNYFPRIYDFIDTNKTFAFNFTEVLVAKNILVLFDVIIFFLNKF